MITVLEQNYRLPDQRKEFRPFVFATGIHNHSYSLPLERRTADFGADSSFCRVNNKLKEHYGITLSESSIRLITLKHAENIRSVQESELGTIEGLPKKCIISETDGSMIPIVKTGDNAPGDKRKKKALFYREARLSLAHETGTVAPVFSATLGNVIQAGHHLAHCVKRVGINDNTKIHCVGDGALWISDQIEEQFGTNATYLVDFYHVCEYLSAASATCSPKNEKIWIETQKARLKENKAIKVCQELYPFIEETSIPDQEAPVRRAHRYLQNRMHQLDYKAAIENDLPIGSGEIESAHRYVIQKRLKIAGAWWLEDNASKMLALRVNRANNDWDGYWRKSAA
jgi:hypothetical protein